MFSQSSIVVLSTVASFSLLSGCSSEAPLATQATPAATPEAMRLHEIAEAPDVPAVKSDQHQRTGIVSSVAAGILRLNEDGQIIDYALANDTPVHYPGGVTKVSDVRRGDKVTLVVEEQEEKSGTTKFVVTSVEKHTTSLTDKDREDDAVE